MEKVTIHYLEMLSREALLPRHDSRGLEVIEARNKQYPLNRFLYQYVGAPWDWTEKLSWSDQRWQDYAEADNLRTWLAYSEGSPAGYFELQRQDGDAVEIRYFGLAPAFLGRGFGGFLLTRAIECAWDWGPVQRVWVHTCSLDHPSALANYEARGMRQYKTEVVAVD